MVADIFGNIILILSILESCKRQALLNIMTKLAQLQREKSTMTANHLPSE